MKHHKHHPVPALSRDGWQQMGADRKTLLAKIARRARARLGRAARLRVYHDWKTIDAVKAEAIAVGLPEVWQWVPQKPVSMARLAEAYVARVAQAYGSVDGLFDVGAYIGARRPICVDIGSPKG